MPQIDLDDLPPRVARLLAELAAGEELVLAQGGLVVARLTVQDSAPTPPADGLAALPPEEQMAEVMSQFNAMIHDEF
ncbi:type II toxin-antitoxin system Phd/YefM family antitoxin [Caulobacter sp. KR2-114]|uniref:type II toxin-antitoxin system Phd/YefM family antitoxin n=1 Tax=Caulobacter sp. KR2-114 TaxID=3400912 RepID=UPI003C08916C